MKISHQDAGRTVHAGHIYINGIHWLRHCPLCVGPFNLHSDFDCCLTLDDLGQEIRRVWVDLARQEPNPKPHHLIGWDELDERNRAIDRKIGQALLKLILTNTVCNSCGGKGDS